MTGTDRLFATELPGPAGTDERIVFLHGLFGQGKNWTSVARELAGPGGVARSQGCVLLLDLPHHGRSPWRVDLDWSALAEAVAAELTDRGGRWTVVGHSLGGKVAMALALARPELVARLVVVDIAPVRYERVGGFADYVTAMRSLDLAAMPGRSEADAGLQALVPDPTVRSFLLQNLRRGPGPQAGNDPSTDQSADQTVDRWHWQMDLTGLGDALDRLGDWPDQGTAAYGGPVLWVLGADSDYVTPASVEPMRRLFPRTRTVTVKGAGHWVHAEQPATFVATVRAFLRERPYEPDQD